MVTSTTNETTGALRHHCEAQNAHQSPRHDFLDLAAQVEELQKQNRWIKRTLLALLCVPGLHAIVQRPERPVFAEGVHQNVHKLQDDVLNASSNPLNQMVGTARFELATSRTPSVRATRLRYVPTAATLTGLGLQLT
jgi:hypothetical protein